MNQWFKCIYKTETLKLLGGKKTNLERIIYNRGAWKTFLIKRQYSEALKEYKRLKRVTIKIRNIHCKITIRKAKRKKTNWEKRFATLSQRAHLTY